MWRRSTAGLLSQAKSLELGEQLCIEPEQSFWKDREKEGKDLMRNNPGAGGKTIDL